MVDRLSRAAHRAVMEAGGGERRLPKAASSDRPVTPFGVAAAIDHAIHKPGTTPVQIDQLCAEALEHRFAGVCLNPVYVRRAADVLAGTGTAVACVVGFPLGGTTPEVKAVEAEQAVQSGATDVEVVIDLGHLKSGDFREVALDLLGVIRRCHERGAIVKVILETSLLTPAEKVAGCLLCREAGADFVRTSTGLGPGGATVEDVALLKRVAGPSLEVKAAGGIRTLRDALAMVAAGATRVGTSAGVEIVREAAGVAEVESQPAARY
jgi:deoxyribose-phosphate aldolase